MKKIRKIMLTMPSCSWLNARTWIFPPYTLALLAAVIPDEYEVEILEPNNENLSIEQVSKRIKDFQPDMVGVSCGSLEYSQAAHKLIEVAKTVDPSILIVLGGVYATGTPELPMEDKNVDFVILGEGEERLPKFLQMLKDGNEDFTKFER